MRPLVVSTLLLSLLTFAANAQNGSCLCDREKLLSAVRKADTIFYGEIQEAKMESADSPTIELTVSVRDPIRGQPSEPVKVGTTLPHNCGVQATIGAHSLFVLIGNEPATLCGGSGWHHYREGHALYDINRLIYALIIVEFVDNDPDFVRSWLNRSYSRGHSRREDMDSLFALIGDLDAESIMTVSDNEVVYKDLVFVFTDGLLVGFFWKDE